MFGIQGWKLIIILIAGLVLIGPDRLPEISKTIGKAIRMFQSAKDDMEKLVRAEMLFPSDTESTIPKAPTTEASSTMASTLYAVDEEEEEEEE